MDQIEKRLKERGHSNPKEGVSKLEMGYTDRTYALSLLRKDVSVIRRMIDAAQFTHFNWPEMESALAVLQDKVIAGTIEMVDLIEFASIYGEYYRGPSGADDSAKLWVDDVFPNLQRFL